MEFFLLLRIPQSWGLVSPCHVVELLKLPVAAGPTPRPFQHVTRDHLSMDKNLTATAYQCCLEGGLSSTSSFTSEEPANKSLFAPAAMRTMIWMAVSLKYRPSPETTRVLSAAAQS